MAYYSNSLFNLDIVNVENEQILQNEVSLGRWIIDALMLLFIEGESYSIDKRIVIKGSNSAIIPDIYLAKGCKSIQIEGKTIIDIRNNLLYDTEIRHSQIIKDLTDGNYVDNYIIVYIRSHDYSLVNNGLLGRVSLLKAENFVNQLKSAIKDGKGLVNKALRNGEKRIKGDEVEWHKKRDSIMQNAINDFNNYNSVIFLGAGVSSSAKMPTWDILLKGLLSNASIFYESDYDAICDEMGNSYLLIARYIQKAANINKKELVETIRKLLYHSTVERSDLITEICNMVQRQKKVESIITYNYDTLIENYLNAHGKKAFSIYRNNRDEGNSFPVYHVHGVVYRDGTNEVENIVLSEEDYHKVYTEVFDWSNVEQLHALTRCTCFFIGLSMKDPNLRRLLEIAKRGSSKGVRHYVFLERKGFADDENKGEKDFQTRENMFADLGLKVIWYEGNDYHKELPRLLKRFVEENNLNE